MNKTPPHIVIVVIWVVLLIYLTFDFFGKANVNFVQFNYDWDASEVIGEVKNVEIDSFSHDYISFKNNFKIPKIIDRNNTFLLKNHGESYFRTSEILNDSVHIIFTGVKWINQAPKENIKHANLEIINLPIIQPKGKTTLTLGDSQIIWREGRELRRNLLQKKTLLYVGAQTDVYGYPYVGGTFDNTNDLLQKLPNAPHSDYYILFFGAQDKGLDKEILKENICTILELLQNKTETEKVFIITLPPSSNPSFNAYNEFFNAEVYKCAAQYNKVQIVDLNHFLLDKKNYLSEDQVHLNETGYLYLNKLLIQEIP